MPQYLGYSAEVGTIARIILNFLLIFFLGTTRPRLRSGSQDSNDDNGGIWPTHSIWRHSTDEHWSFWGTTCSATYFSVWRYNQYKYSQHQYSFWCLWPTPQPANGGDEYWQLVWGWCLWSTTTTTAAAAAASTTECIWRWRHVRAAASASAD